MTGSVHVVIVNCNTGDCLQKCLTSLADSQGAEITRVSVIDNASSDDSAVGLDGKGLPVEFVKNAQNVGFAAACNQGAAGSTADYLLFLNPDTRVHPAALATVLGFMASAQAGSVGICGAQVLDDQGCPAFSCARFPTLRIMLGKMTRLDRLLPQIFPSHHLTSAELQRSRPVDQVIGAFFLVRRPLFELLGGFDERYFLYFEEVDLALRARAAGAQSYFLKEAVVSHSGSVSSSKDVGMRLSQSLRSRLLFAYRHWDHQRAEALTVLTFTVELPLRLANALVHRDRPEFAATLAGYRRLVAELPSVRSSTNGGVKWLRPHVLRPCESHALDDRSAELDHRERIMSTERDLRDYLRTLRRRWPIVISILVVCVCAAGAYAWTRTPTYTASTQLFVSASAPPGNPTQSYEGGLFAQQRVLSYVSLVSSAPVVQDALRSLGYHDSITKTQGEVQVSVPTGTVLLNVSVTDHSAIRAKTLADAVAGAFIRFVQKLETPRVGQPSYVKMTVVTPATLPTSPSSARKPLYLVLGALLGLVLGIGVAVLVDSLSNDHDRQEAVTAESGRVPVDVAR
ncbi:MAG: glycosyltransferase [Solirubrobacteraceae bacterium]